MIIGIFIFCSYIIGIIIIGIIFYYVVKAAVKNGIREAFSDKILPPSFRINKPANPDQIKLQQRDDNGEITLEMNQDERNKLNT